MSRTSRSHRPPMSDTKLENELRKKRRKRRRDDRKRAREAIAEAGEMGERSCARKYRYANVQEAMSHAERIRALYGNDRLVQTAYRCDLCGGWHLTSHPWRGSDGGK